jgi:hypothetical protein
MNTHNPALITLKKKGYELWIDPPKTEEGEVDLSQHEIGLWWAKKQEHEFYADDPLSLLGLVSIWESRGDSWINEDDVDIYDQLLTETYGDE